MNTDESLLKNKDKATLTVAYTLLFTFVSSLIFLAVITVVSSKNPESKAFENWMGLLKNSLVLIGTALTTIIGYYFGQRESSEAHKEAAEAKSQLVPAEKTIDDLRSELAERVSITDKGNDSEDFFNTNNKQKPKQ